MKPQAQKKHFESSIIRALEMKMLPSPTGRDRNESPKLALSRDEQLVYADYLESVGQTQGAAFFRLESDFGLNRRKEKTDKAKIIKPKKEKKTK